MANCLGRRCLPSPGVPAGRRPDESCKVTDRQKSALADKYFASLSPYVEPGEEYALVDFPDYFNVGDSAIYAGEMAFFDQYAQRSPAYVCTLSSYQRDIDHYCPQGVIFLQGGGNFGSIWRKHQDLRLDVLKTYRGRRVVQLPQSLHFADTVSRDRTARSIDRHGDFVLLVRDQPSFEFAQRHFNCAVHLCPDAAHNLRHLPVSKPPRHKVLSILRDDKEAKNDDIRSIAENLGPVADWRRQPWARSPIDQLDRVIAPRLPPSRALMARRERAYRRQAWRRIRFGVKLLEQGELLISDRLHVHIMATLMQRRHISLDNSYGKISRYIDAWGENELVTRASGLIGLKDALSQVYQSDDYAGVEPA